MKENIFLILGGDNRSLYLGEYLEKRGIIYSLVGKGSFVAPEAVEIIKKKYNSDFKDFKEALIKYRATGVKKESLIEIINSIYTLEEN